MRAHEVLEFPLVRAASITSSHDLQTAGLETRILIHTRAFVGVETRMMRRKSPILAFTGHADIRQGSPTCPASSAHCVHDDFN